MKKICFIPDVAERMARQPALKAVRVSAGGDVTAAWQPGAATDRERAGFERDLSRVPFGERPTCQPADGQSRCRECPDGPGLPLPEGVRVEVHPDGALLIEKTSCETARRLWHWTPLPLHVETRHVDKPSEAHDHDDWRKDLAFAIVCGVATAAGFALERLGGGALRTFAIVLYAVAYISGAWHPAQETWELLRRRILDVHFLMLCVAVGAALIGHWWEGALLLFLFSFSGALEELAMARTEREIASLFKAAPKEASVVGADGTESRVPVDAIQAGMLLRVRPGEQFAVDGEIVTGASAADESNLTGEAVPVEKAAGDAVYSGTMNLWGSVDCLASRPASESALSKIITLIQEAQDSKAPSQRFTDHFGTPYTYGILGLSIAMFLYWWLGAGLPAFADPADGSKSAFYRAMTLLVVASPCALVLSIPSAILAGIAAGARHGVLFRGGSAIEQLAGITRVGLDKTGTLTTGELEIVAVETVPPGREADLALVAASLGHHSTHPVSRALARYGRQTSAPLPIGGFRSNAGHGVEGEMQFEGAARTARMGRRTMFAGDWVTAMPLPQPGVTETLIECGPVRGRVLLRDHVRVESAHLLRQLEAQQIKATMLTGDRPEAAHLVSDQLGLKDVKAGLSPEQKVAAIRSWVANGERVAMIGDGVNDAPSLAAAHVAVGMGLRGSDAVLEQADVILMKDRLENFNFAITLSRRARGIIRQNLAISLGTVFVLVASALGSSIPLPIGVVGHEGSTVIVVMNSLRLLFFRPERQKPST